MGDALGVADPSQEEARDQNCVDDPVWADEDGDGCVAYEGIIAHGVWTMYEACGYVAAPTMASGNPHEAQLRCPVTCGTCPHLARSVMHTEPSLGQKLLKASIEKDWR